MKMVSRECLFWRLSLGSWQYTFHEWAMLTGLIWEQFYGFLQANQTVSSLVDLGCFIIISSIITLPAFFKQMIGFFVLWLLFFIFKKQQTIEMVHFYDHRPFALMATVLTLKVWFRFFLASDATKSSNSNYNALQKSFIEWIKITYLSLNPHTSSIRRALSARVACVTHFSTTLLANLCWLKASTFPLTLLINWDLSSGLPCSAQKQRQCHDVKCRQLWIFT